MWIDGLPGLDFHHSSVHSNRKPPETTPSAVKPEYISCVVFVIKSLRPAMLGLPLAGRSATSVALVGPAGVHTPSPVGPGWNEYVAPAPGWYDADAPYSVSITGFCVKLRIWSNMLV